eukprot:5625337-Pyramimonas_sp.AAC.1
MALVINHRLSRRRLSGGVCVCVWCHGFHGGRRSVTELEVHKGLLGAAHKGTRAMVVARKLSKRAQKACLMDKARAPMYLDHTDGEYDEAAQLMLQELRERVHDHMVENGCESQYKVRDCEGCYFRATSANTAENTAVTMHIR